MLGDEVARGRGRERDDMNGEKQKFTGVTSIPAASRGTNVVSWLMYHQDETIRCLDVCCTTGEG